MQKIHQKLGILASYEELLAIYMKLLHTGKPLQLPLFNAKYADGIANKINVLHGFNVIQNIAEELLSHSHPSLNLTQFTPEIYHNQEIARQRMELSQFNAIEKAKLHIITNNSLVLNNLTIMPHPNDAHERIQKHLQSLSAIDALQQVVHQLKMNKSHQLQKTSIFQHLNNMGIINLASSKEIEVLRNALWGVGTEATRVSIEKYENEADTTSTHENMHMG